MQAIHATMTDGDVTAVAGKAIWITLQVGGPILIVGLIVGLVVSIFQAVTQIQEQTLVFIPKIIAIVAVVGIVVWLFVFKAGKDWWLLVPMSLVMGGILGNLYDRLGLWHGADPAPHEVRAVRDWVYFRLEGVPGFDPWPNFNFADSLLVCGAALLFFHLAWILPRQEKARALAAEQAAKEAESTVNPSA